MGRRKRQKRHGHYCWVCARQRPNERFSGKGHGKHVCRDCAKLGAEELAYRQSVRDLERCVTWEGFIRHKERAAFERFLQHDDPRVRALAEELERADLENRRRPRDDEWQADEVQGLRADHIDHWQAAELEDTPGIHDGEFEDDDIPF